MGRVEAIVIDILQTATGEAAKDETKAKHRACSVCTIYVQYGKL